MELLKVVSSRSDYRDLEFLKVTLDFGKLLVATAMCADPVFEGAFVASGGAGTSGVVRSASGRLWSGLGALLGVSGMD